ncbi:protein spinster homolog 3 isoform X2 [Columba livia]|uniref:protein spinster homolog 3 isoform X2 n=1 Tax=Columba livia TaxID=8932 RepID=UPI0031BB7A45
MRVPAGPGRARSPRRRRPRQGPCARGQREGVGERQRLTPRSPAAAPLPSAAGPALRPFLSPRPGSNSSFPAPVPPSSPGGAPSPLPAGSLPQHAADIPAHPAPPARIPGLPAPLLPSVPTEPPALLTTKGEAASPSRSALPGAGHGSKKDFMESCHENEAVMPQQSGNSLGSQFMLPVLKHNSLSEKSGLGYVLAAGMAEATGDWHWAFRVTPCMGGLALVLLILLVPHRTQRRTAAHRALSISGTIREAAEKPGVHRAAKTTWCQDVISLAKNWSFVWSSLGLTAMAFVTGALGMWVPLFLYRAQVVQGIVSPCLQESCNSSNSLIFGGITIGTGILGVIAGAEAARRLRKINNKADPLICAASMFVSALCLYIALMVAQTNILSTFIFIAFGELFLSVNWAVVTDILLYVVTPRRQSTAIALQILVSHLLGDAGSPYLIGIISNAIQARNAHSFQWSFWSMQYSFILCAFVGVFGGGFFLLTSFYIEEDRKEAEKH